MRWQNVLVALGLGMIGGAGWALWDQSRQQASAASIPVQRQAEVSKGAIPLVVQQDHNALRLRWSPKIAGIRDAQHGKLIITDGDHSSTLSLDARELQSGLASYWPDGDRVSFRLETDDGAAGSIAATISGQPAVDKHELAVDDHEPLKTAAPAKRRAKSLMAREREASLDDGLEWTEQPRPIHRIARDSRWTRLKKKLPFWHRSSTPDSGR
jgi:hypothetical protein